MLDEFHEAAGAMNHRGLLGRLCNPAGYSDFEEDVGNFYYATTLFHLRCSEDELVLEALDRMYNLNIF